MYHKIIILKITILLCLFNFLTSNLFCENQFDDNAYYIFNSKKTGLTLDVYSNKTHDNAPLVLYKETGKQNQKFKIIKSDEPDYYYLQGEQSAKFIDLDAQGQLIIKTADKSDNQKWKLILYENGYYKIISKKTGKALDIIEGGKDIPAKLIFAGLNENETQFWKIKKFYPSQAEDNKLLTEANNECNFEKALIIFEEIIKNYPDMDNYNIIMSAANARYFQLLKYLGNIDMNESLICMNKLDDILMKNEKAKAYYYKNKNIDFLKTVIKKRTDLGEIKPQYVQKILVLFVKSSDFHTKYPDGKALDIKSEITAQQRILSEITISLLKTFVETFSEGNMSLEFNKIDINSAFTEFTVFSDPPYNSVPNYTSLVPYPSEILFENASNGKTDTMIWIYPNNLSVKDWGGSSYFPLIPYHMNLDKRGFSELHTLWINPRIYSHEFMHSLGSRIKNKLFNVHYGKEDIEAWKSYGYEETDELNTLWFMFKTFIPLYIKELEQKNDYRGWKIFSYSSEYPGKLGKEKFLYNLQEASKVPIDKRRQSMQLKEKADEAWKNDDKTLCDKLYKEAFAVNPAFFHYYKYQGDRDLENKDYEKAVKMYKNYIKYIDQSFYYRKIGDIYLYNIKDIDNAVKFYKSGLELCATDTELAEYCARTSYNLLNAGRFEDVIFISGKGIGLPGKYAVECLYYYGEALFKTGNKDEGIKFMLDAIDPQRTGILDEKSNLVKRYKKLGL